MFWTDFTNRQDILPETHPDAAELQSEIYTLASKVWEYECSWPGVLQGTQKPAGNFGDYCAQLRYLIGQTSGLTQTDQCRLATQIHAAIRRIWAIKNRKR